MFGLFVATSTLTRSSRLALWFLVTLSVHTSRALNLPGWTHLQHTWSVWGHKVCNLLALIFICVDILYILVFALSLLVESGHCWLRTVITQVRPNYPRLAEIWNAEDLERGRAFWAARCDGLNDVGWSCIIFFPVGEKSLLDGHLNRSHSRIFTRTLPLPPPLWLNSPK